MLDNFCSYYSTFFFSGKINTFIEYDYSISPLLFHMLCIIFTILCIQACFYDTRCVGGLLSCPPSRILAVFKLVYCVMVMLKLTHLLQLNQSFMSSEEGDKKKRRVINNAHHKQHAVLIIY